MNPKTASDEALMKAVTEKNIAAFEELYDRHHPAALAVAYRVLGDRQLAEDVIQETFLSLWRQAESFRPALGTVRTWLLSVARHRAIDITRGRAFTTQSLPPDEQMFGPYLDVEQEVSQRLDKERIQRAIETIPSEQKEAIMLAFYGGYTYKEIAERLGVPLGTVKGRIRLGMQKLRSLLDDNGKGGAH
jgi:RNA polymerase sigma-70 factor (ECF subfamily)